MAMERAVVRSAAAEVESLVWRGLATWAVATICDSKIRMGDWVGLVTWIWKWVEDKSWGVELSSPDRSWSAEGGGRESGRVPGSVANGEPSAGFPKTSPTSRAVAKVGTLESSLVRTCIV